MASDKLNFKVSEYVETLMGRDSVMDSTKQTSVRISTSSLDEVDILAEMGSRSRNRIINDALAFGLQLIKEQFSTEDKERFLEMMKKRVSTSNMEQSVKKAN